MKVRDLIGEIDKCKLKYGDEFLDWDVYTEQISEEDKLAKTKGIQKDWGKVGDGEGWEYFHCIGFWSEFADKKIFTINVNY